MGKKDQTTVNLNELAQKVKEDLAPIYGLKNILSDGSAAATAPPNAILIKLRRFIIQSFLIPKADTGRESTLVVIRSDNSRPAVV